MVKKLTFHLRENLELTKSHHGLIESLTQLLLDMTRWPVELIQYTMQANI